MNSKIEILKVPDSAIFVVIKESLTKIDMKSFLEENQQILEFPKLRFVFDIPEQKLDLIESIKLFCDLKQIKFKILDYNTNFFIATKADSQRLVEQNPTLNWTNYKSNFYYKIVSKEDLEVQKILKNFMLNSFGVDFVYENGRVLPKKNDQKQEKIENNFAKALANPNLEMVLVSKNNSDLVGCYALISLNKDLQLYSVAGMSTLKMCVEKKLPILMSSLLSIFNNSKKYEHFEKLTLSNSKQKVSEIYKNLGLAKNNDRKGLILEIIK
jgi:hypothetical protein